MRAEDSGSAVTDVTEDARVLAALATVAERLGYRITAIVIRKKT